MAATRKDNLVTVGKVSTAYGVKGWVNVFSYTDPPANLLSYKNWVLRYPDGHEQQLQVVNGKAHRNGFVVCFEGIDGREQARALTGAQVQIDEREMPALDDGEFYWHQLEGLAVMVRNQDGTLQRAGEVSYLFETGANDVMVVDLDEEFVKARAEAPGQGRDSQWLVPVLLDQVIVSIDLDHREIEVDWWFDQA